MIQSQYPLIRAALKQPVPYTPVWLMRQAGRYMPEFRAIRAEIDFLSLCKNAERMVEVSLLPVQQLDIDGAIIFFDLLIPAEAMGSQLEYAQGEGPVIHNPVRSAADVAALAEPDPAAASPALGQAIQWLSRELEGRMPVLGFTGAPWTLAAYMIEGGGSKNYSWIKQMMYRESVLFEQLMQKASRVLADYLVYQAESGAQLVQIFDTWAGCLSEADYRQFALPYTQQVIAETKKRCQVPVVLYLNGCAHLLEAMAESGADVLSIDWRISMAEAQARVGDRVALQGNLDPCLLYGSPELIDAQVQRIIAEYGQPTGHVFNLGHGLLPDIPVENVRYLLASVRRHGRH